VIALDQEWFSRAIRRDPQFQWNRQPPRGRNVYIHVTPHIYITLAVPQNLRFRSYDRQRGTPTKQTSLGSHRDRFASESPPAPRPCARMRRQLTRTVRGQFWDE